MFLRVRATQSNQNRCGYQLYTHTHSCHCCFCLLRAPTFAATRARAQIQQRQYCRRANFTPIEARHQNTHTHTHAQNKERLPQEAVVALPALDCVHKSRACADLRVASRRCARQITGDARLRLDVLCSLALLRGAREFNGRVRFWPELMSMHDDDGDEVEASNGCTNSRVREFVLRPIREHEQTV